MIRLLCFVLAVLAASIKSMKLEAENAVLRHQLTVLRRRLQARVQLTNNDRRYLIVVYRLFPSILQVLIGGWRWRAVSYSRRRMSASQGGHHRGKYHAGHSGRKEDNSHDPHCHDRTRRPGGNWPHHYARV
jgi:hypothetical protein